MHGEGILSSVLCLHYGSAPGPLDKKNKNTFCFFMRWFIILANHKYSTLPRKKTQLLTLGKIILFLHLGMDYAYHIWCDL